jgi:hypothetical protein
MGGRSMSQTIDIGRIAVNPSGDYAAANTYNKLDLVYHNGSTWMAKRDNITGIEPGDTSSIGATIASLVAWQKTAAGTELGSTLPDEGDMLVNDGTNLSALPIGTAGQLLTVNAAGTQPEWQDRAGGLKVKLHQHQWSSSQTLSTSPVAITDSLFSITPMSPSSKFRVFYDVQAYHGASGNGWDMGVQVTDTITGWTYIVNHGSNAYASYGGTYSRIARAANYELSGDPAVTNVTFRATGEGHTSNPVTNYNNTFYSYCNVMEFWEE